MSRKKQPKVTVEEAMHVFDESVRIANVDPGEESYGTHEDIFETTVRWYLEKGVDLTTFLIILNELFATARGPRNSRDLLEILTKFLIATDQFEKYAKDMGFTSEL